MSSVSFSLGRFTGESAEGIRTKQFANGDIYSGTWKYQKPDGDGSYTWEDGSNFDGTWQGGLKHGVGKYVWASGAVYQGEWRQGSMHGVGTYTAPPRSENAPDSTASRALAASINHPVHALFGSYGGARMVSRYQGSWLNNKRHGLGKQIYSNGDTYEGLWRAGLQEGPGRYSCSNGNEYDGEWSMGCMSGQGTFVWTTGERYDGRWERGLPHGVGVLTLPDNSTFESQWLEGKRHGVCLCCISDTLNRRPGPLKRVSPGSQHALVSPRESEVMAKKSLIARNFSELVSARAVMDFKSTFQKSGQNGEAVSSVQHNLSRGLSNSAEEIKMSVPDSAASLGDVANNKTYSTFLREYENGQVLREWPVRREDTTLVMSQQYDSRSGSGLGKMLRSRTSSGFTQKDSNVERLGKSVTGELIDKEHQSYSIMLGLQLGLRYSVTRVTPEPSPRELDDFDYQMKVKQFFPRSGTEMTAAHSADEFVWKDYAPMVFRKLREVFEIDAGSYMRSLCGDTALRFLSSPGKSGAVFLLSTDDLYMVKTIKKNEADLLLRMLPAYYRHVSTHPHTLLTKFYGLHRITVKSGRKVFLVVMGNLFSTMLQLHRKFDLKGSQLGRCVSEEQRELPHTIFKDLDLDMTFRLEDGWLDRLMFQLKADCSLLEQCHIMDYSLLLGVHFPSREGEAEDAAAQQDDGQHVRMRPVNFSEASVESEFKNNFSRMCEKLSRTKLPQDARAVLVQLFRARLDESLERTGQQHTRRLALTHTDELALELGRSRVQLGVNMPAQAITNDKSGGRSEDVVLYFGIIDILQDYNTKKHLEHKLKSIVHDSYAVSVTNPKVYSQRFQSFLLSVFS